MLSAYPPDTTHPDRASSAATCRMASSFDSATAPTRTFAASISSIQTSPERPHRSGRRRRGGRVYPGWRGGADRKGIFAKVLVALLGSHEKALSDQGCSLIPRG